MELECFWFRLYGTCSPSSSSSNTAGPSSESQLFGQGISQNSCFWEFLGLHLPGFQLYCMELFTISIPFQWEGPVQVKARKLHLTLSRSGRRNMSRDAAHTTFSSSSCSLFCNTSRCGCKCCWNSSWCTLPRVGSRVLPKIPRNCVTCAELMTA